MSKLITQLVYYFIENIHIRTVYDPGVNVVYKVAMVMGGRMHVRGSVTAAVAEFDGLRGSRGRLSALASSAN